MKSYKIKDRQNNKKIITHDYLDFIYWYWEWDEDDIEINSDLFIDYEYLSEDIQTKILSNIPYFSSYYSEQFGFGGRRWGILVDNISYYSLAKKRDLLIDSIFSLAHVEEPIIAEYCKNWNQLSQIYLNS